MEHVHHEQDSATISVYVVESATGEIVAVVGKVTGVTDLDQEVDFGASFDHPVVFVQPPSFVGADTSSVQIWDVTCSFFKFHIQEISPMDNCHAAAEEVSFLVV